MKKLIVLILTAILLLSLFGCSGASSDTVGTISGATKAEESVDIFTSASEPDDSGYVTCDYNGVERKFILYKPEGAGENAPLVFMLHGYGGSAKGFMDSTDMNNAAESKGYAVVYPQGIRDAKNSTGGACWNSGLNDSPNDDTGFLVSLAQYLQQTYGFSSSATFAAGFSNGAFMMYKLAYEAPDTFRAVASVSGTMSGGAWAERPDSASVGILQISGTADDVVPIEKDGVYGDAPAIGGVIEFWKNANKLEKYEEVKISEKATAYCYSSDSNDNQVCYIEIEGGSHSWPVKDSAGFDANERILDFFSSFVK